MSNGQSFGIAPASLSVFSASGGRDREFYNQFVLQQCSLLFLANHWLVFIAQELKFQDAPQTHLFYLNWCLEPKYFVKISEKYVTHKYMFCPVLFIQYLILTLVRLLCKIIFSNFVMHFCCFNFFIFLYFNSLIIFYFSFSNCILLT